MLQNPKKLMGQQFLCLGIDQNYLIQNNISLKTQIKMMTAGAPPPEAVLSKMASCGIEVIHVYGLTEIYGPAVVCAWHPEWSELEASQQAKLKARQ